MNQSVVENALSKISLLVRICIKAGGPGSGRYAKGSGAKYLPKFHKSKQASFKPVHSFSNNWMHEKMLGHLKSHGYEYSHTVDNKDFYYHADNFKGNKDDFIRVAKGGKWYSGKDKIFHGEGATSLGNHLDGLSVGTSVAHTVNNDIVSPTKKIDSNITPVGIKQQKLANMHESLLSYGYEQKYSTFDTINYVKPGNTTESINVNKIDATWRAYKNGIKVHQGFGPNDLNHELAKENNAKPLTLLTHTGSLQYDKLLSDNGFTTDSIDKDGVAIYTKNGTEEQVSVHPSGKWFHFTNNGIFKKTDSGANELAKQLATPVPVATKAASIVAMEKQLKLANFKLDNYDEDDIATWTDKYGTKVLVNHALGNYSVHNKNGSLIGMGKNVDNLSKNLGDVAKDDVRTVDTFSRHAKALEKAGFVKDTTTIKGETNYTKGNESYSENAEKDGGWYKFNNTTGELLDEGKSLTTLKLSLPESMSNAEKASNILGKKVGDAQGSNEGGIYEGKDGIKRYVKFYKDPGQGRSELMANKIYDDLGAIVPKAQMFIHNGKEAFASDMIDNTKQMGKAGLNADNAKKILEHYAADVLLDNWDVIGLMKDNILLKGQGVIRVDNGASFLYRAQGSLKPAASLDQLTEWNGFASPTVNENYADVFKAANIMLPENIPNIKTQVQNIVDIYKEGGNSWNSYLIKHGEHLTINEHQAMTKMLDARTKLLAAKVGINLDDVAKEVNPKSLGYMENHLNNAGFKHSGTTPEGNKVYQKSPGGTVVIKHDGSSYSGVATNGTPFSGKNSLELKAHLTNLGPVMQETPQAAGQKIAEKHGFTWYAKSTGGDDKYKSADGKQKIYIKPETGAWQHKVDDGNGNFGNKNTGSTVLSLNEYLPKYAAQAKQMAKVAIGPIKSLHPFTRENMDAKVKELLVKYPNQSGSSESEVYQKGNSYGRIHLDEWDLNFKDLMATSNGALPEGLSVEAAKKLVDPTWTQHTNWKQQAYGGVVVNDKGEFLLREPKNHFDGYNWTFSKGKMDSAKEHPVDTALREVSEETGYGAKIIDTIPGNHKTSSNSNFYLMRTDGKAPQAHDDETESMKWLSYDDAKAHIMQSTNIEGQKRDLNILDVAQEKLKTVTQPDPAKLLIEAAKGQGLYAEIFAHFGLRAADAHKANSMIDSWAGGSSDNLRKEFAKAIINAPDAVPGLVLEASINQTKLRPKYPDGVIPLYRGVKAGSSPQGKAVAYLRSIAEMGENDYVDGHEYSFKWKSDGGDSWSISKSVAKGFAGDNGIVVHQPMPIEHILSAKEVSLTGPLYASEEEYVSAPIGGYYPLSHTKTTLMKAMANILDNGKLVIHRLLQQKNMPKGVTIDHNEKTITVDLSIFDHNWMNNPNDVKPYVEVKGTTPPRSMQAGGVGSGRHASLEAPPKRLIKGPLRTTKREADLAIARKKVQDEYAKNKEEGKSARGRPILNDKQKKAQASVVTAKKEHQDRAEELERLVAKKVGGMQSENNRPFDVTHTNAKGQRHAIEVKGVLMQHNDKITMKRDAIDRKNEWSKKNKHKVHTVAVDLRGKTPVVYHRLGVGSFRLGNMDKVKGGLSGLHALFN